MKIRLKLRNPNGIACDPETRITWTGERIEKTEITVFVASAIARGLLERVDVGEEDLVKILRAVTKRFPANDWCDDINETGKPCGECKCCKTKRQIDKILAEQDEVIE